MSFVPFFPGRSWNLYFGSEPLFLLLAFGAVACAVRAEAGSWRWSLAGGVLAALAYLTRLEGAVLAGVLLVVLAARLALRRERRGRLASARAGRGGRGVGGRAVSACICTASWAAGR